MGKLRTDARGEYVTALRALRTGGEQADFVRHRSRALVEDIDRHVRDETVPSWPLRHVLRFNAGVLGEVVLQRLSGKGK